MKAVEVIKTTLTSPEAVVWEGDALSISSTNSDGLFDLFPDHARFMTLLENVDLTIRQPDSSDQVFPIEKAVLLFQDSTAKIYLHKHIKPVLS
jgi:F0F1-type ATP synthase epsilon subunit